MQHQQQHLRVVRSGYGHVLVAGQSIEGFISVDSSGTLHVDQAKLRHRDSAQPDGVRRQPVLPRTFGPQPYEVRWMRPRPESNGVTA